MVVWKPSHGRTHSRLSSAPLCLRRGVRSSRLCLIVNVHVRLFWKFGHPGLTPLGLACGEFPENLQYKGKYSKAVVIVLVVNFSFFCFSSHSGANLGMIISLWEWSRFGSKLHRFWDSLRYFAPSFFKESKM